MLVAYLYKSPVRLDHKIYSVQKNSRQHSAVSFQFELVRKPMASSVRVRNWTPGLTTSTDDCAPTRKRIVVETGLAPSHPIYSAVRLRPQDLLQVCRTSAVGGATVPLC